MSATADSAPRTTREPLDRRRVYIFLTRHGIMLGSMMFVILLGSINYDNALGYLLTFLLFGLLLVTMLHTYRNLAGLAYLGANAKPVFAGERAEFIAVFDNRGRWARYSIEVARWPPLRRRWPWRRRRAAAAAITNLEADAICRVAVHVPARARGRLQLRRIRLTSTFPLGVLRSWAYFEDPAACIVYPRAEGPLPLPEDGAAATTATVGTRPGNDDFAGFRTYQPGDPIRAIAWKNLARSDTVLVKRFTSGSAARIVLSWRHCASLADTEGRLSQLAAWIVEAEHRGLSYGLDIPGVQLPPAAGAAHRHECLAALALFSP